MTEESRLEKIKNLFNKVKKIVDAADDIWLGLRNMIPSLSKQVASFLVGSLGTVVHGWEGFLASVELKNAYLDTGEAGSRKARMAAAALAIIFTGVGAGLGISLLLDTAGLIDASGVALYPFLMSSFLLSIYTVYLARSFYLFKKAPAKADDPEAYDMAKIEFKYGAAEVCASSIALFGLILGTEDYFEGVKTLEPTLTDHSSYLIFAGVLLGFIVMVGKQQAEKAAKCSYSSINYQTSSSQASSTVEDTVENTVEETLEETDLYDGPLLQILNQYPDVLKKVTDNKKPTETLLQTVDRLGIDLRAPDQTILPVEPLCESNKNSNPTISLSEYKPTIGSNLTPQ